MAVSPDNFLIAFNPVCLNQIEKTFFTFDRPCFALRINTSKRKMKPIYFIILSFMIGFSACSNKINKQRKPVTNILITPSNKTLRQGNEISVFVQAKLFNAKLDRIELFIDNQILTISEKENFSYILQTKDLVLGHHSIGTKTYNRLGQSSTHYAQFLIVSDIEPQKPGFRIEKIFNHQPDFFTQGLEFYKGKLYEGTGNYGASKIVLYDSSKEKIVKEKKLEDSFFGERITLLNGKLYQLTYKSQKAFVYDAHTLERLREFSFSSREGWGLCNDGKYLIMSNGSSIIHYLDTLSFQRVKSIEVCDHKGCIQQINELEYHNGAIYANLWMTNSIIKIDAQSGQVLSLYDLSDLLSYFDNKNMDVMNGIAFHPSENRFYVTGKYWPKLFALTLE